MSHPSRPAAQFKHPDRFYVAGRWMKPHSASTFGVVDPSTEEVLYDTPEANEADVEAAIAAARTAFDEGPWPRLSHAERAGYLRAIAAGLAERVPELGDLWTLETGVVNSLARGLTGFTPGIFVSFAAMAETFAFEEVHKPAGGGFGLLVREPVGVVGAIVPWNATLQILSLKLAPALLAGCTVVAKAPLESPGSVYVLAEIIEAAGLPPGVFNFVAADRRVSELLVRDTRVDKISFTGSSTAGRQIAAICGERMARCTLELGGKSAAIVLDDYDVAEVAASMSASTRRNSGQVCSALTRIIVSRRRHDDLVDALATEFAQLKVGDPFDANTDMGPLAMRRQHDRVLSFIAKGKEEGARLVVGGGAPTHCDRGFFVSPTLFAGATNDMVIAREEIFGPVLTVIPAEDEDAVRIANDSPFGLNGAVFTNSPDRAYAVARRIHTGTVGQNGSRSAFDIAFGGVKQSGIGREGGVEGLLAYLEPKTIILDSAPSHRNGRS